LKLTGRVELDALYDEFSSSKEALQHIVKCEKSAGENGRTFLSV